MIDSADDTLAKASRRWLEGRGWTVVELREWDEGVLVWLVKCTNPHCMLHARNKRRVFAWLEAVEIARGVRAALYTSDREWDDG